jgi:hypothetical protein
MDVAATLGEYDQPSIWYAAQVLRLYSTVDVIIYFAIGLIHIVQKE